MRVGIHQDVWAGSEGDEHLQHLRDISALAASCVELAITVCSSTALTKTVVAIRIDDMSLRDGGQVSPTLPHVFAALQNDWLQPMFDAAKRGEKSRWPRTDDQHDGRAVHIRQRNRRPGSLNERLIRDLDA